jgi:hypothetical protein
MFAIWKPEEATMSWNLKDSVETFTQVSHKGNQSLKWNNGLWIQGKGAIMIESKDRKYTFKCWNIRAFLVRLLVSDSDIVGQLYKSSFTFMQK